MAKVKPVQPQEPEDERMPREKRESLARELNERARLYPWETFNRFEIELMTGYPREAVRAAFGSPEMPSQFDRSRPEDVRAWVLAQDKTIQVKQLRNARK